MTIQNQTDAMLTRAQLFLLPTLIWDENILEEDIAKILNLNTEHFSGAFITAQGVSLGRWRAEKGIKTNVTYYVGETKKKDYVKPRITVAKALKPLLEGDKTPQQTANHMSMTLPQLNRVFNEVFQKTAEQIQKIAKLKDLINDKTITIGQIATAMNMENSSLSQFCKRHLGQYPKELREKKQIELPKKMPSWMPKAEDLIRNPRQYDLNEVAAKTGIYRSTLNRGFKSFHKMTPVEWRKKNVTYSNPHSNKLKNKVERMKVRLKNRTLQIQDIAPEFDMNHSDFTECFKNVTDMSPTEWREKFGYTYIPKPKPMPEWMPDFQRYLLDPAKPEIKEFAERLGKDAKGISKLFKRATGLSPVNWRTEMIRLREEYNKHCNQCPLKTTSTPIGSGDPVEHIINFGLRIHSTLQQDIAA